METVEKIDKTVRELWKTAFTTFDKSLLDDVEKKLEGLVCDIVEIVDHCKDQIETLGTTPEDTEKKDEYERTIQHLLDHDTLLHNTLIGRRRLIQGVITKMTSLLKG